MTPAQVDRLLAQIQYPGLTWVESQIARRWIERHAADYDSLDFNVRLGEGVDVGEAYDEPTRRAARLLTQKRADIVAAIGQAVDLIEVKVRIAFPVIGQLIGYRGLWLREHPETTRVRLIAIGRSVVPDLGTIIEEQGIAIETFPLE